MPGLVLPNSVLPNSVLPGSVLPGSVLPGSVLPDRVLRQSLIEAGAGAQTAAGARIRLSPASRVDRGDLCTSAAMLCASSAAMPPWVLAERLAQRLACHPVVREARPAGAGFVNLTMRDDAFDGVPESLLASPAAAPEPAALTIRLCDMRRDGREFMVQYAHARCRSVARAAAAAGHAADMPPEAPPAASLGVEARALLCRLDHWRRMTEPGGGGTDGRMLRFYLHDLAACFDRMWKRPPDGATVRGLQPGQPTRSLAHLALVLATAWVLRAGLGRLGVVAAEEIR